MEKIPFYKSEWFMWVVIVLFFPIGLIMLWSQKRYVVSLRIAITAVFFLYGGLFYTYLLTPSSPTVPSSNFVDDWEKATEDDEPSEPAVSADTLFEEEIQPQMDDIITEYDRIWNTHWKQAFAGNTSDSFTLSNEMKEVQEQYDELILTIDEIDIPDEFSHDQQKEVKEFKDYFILSSSHRQEAAEEAQLMFDDNNINEYTIGEIEDIVHKSDESLLQAITSYTLLKENLGDGQ